MEIATTARYRLLVAEMDATREAVDAFLAGSPSRNGVDDLTVYMTEFAEVDGGAAVCARQMMEIIAPYRNA